VTTKNIAIPSSKVNEKSVAPSLSFD